MTPRRRARRLALGALLFACANSTSCGTPGAHDLEVYAYRAGPTEDRIYTLADGSTHTIELRGIAQVSTATLAQVVNVMSRLPPEVARSCESITYIAQYQFHSDNVVGDAHSSLNAGNICLIREPLEDWLVHEVAHQYRNGADEDLVAKFDGISPGFYGRGLGPMEVAGNKARRWDPASSVPCGPYGPARGGVSAYAANNSNECQAEIVEALYCFTYHTRDTCNERANNPYDLIAMNPAEHKIEDHIARVDALLAMGAINQQMKTRFDGVVAQIRAREIATLLASVNR